MNHSPAKKVFEYLKANFLRLAFLFCVVIMILFLSAYAIMPKIGVGIGSEWWYSVKSGGQARMEPLIYDELVRLVGIESCGLMLCYKIKIENPFYIRFDYALDDGVIYKTVLYEKETGTKYHIHYQPPLRYSPVTKELGKTLVSHASVTVSIDSPTEGARKELLMIDFFANVTGRDSFLIGNSVYGAIVINEEINGRLVRRVWLIDGLMYPIRYELPESASWGYMTSFKQTDNRLDFLHVSVAGPLKLWHLAVGTAFLFILDYSYRRSVKTETKSKSF